MNAHLPRERRYGWRPARLAASIVLVAGLGGCWAGSGAPGRAASDGVPRSATVLPTAVTLAFAGDVHFAGRTARLLDRPDTAFGPVAAVLSGADVAMANLETAVTQRGTPEPKTFHFRAPPAAYESIKAAGIDVVTLANNHALDYGRVGLDDTLRAARSAGMPVVGAGGNAAEAYRPWITAVKGVRIAVIGVSQIDELAGRWAATPQRSGIAMAFDTARAVGAVRAAAEQADAVVVYVHWGQEYHQCPTADMRSFASAMADAGATIVVGTHAHVLLGAGWLGSTYVAYGLSNFLWWYNDAGSNDTGVLTVTLASVPVAAGPPVEAAAGARRRVAISSTRFVPAYIDRATGQPVPSTGAQAARIDQKFTGLRRCTGLATRPRT